MTGLQPRLVTWLDFHYTPGLLPKPRTSETRTLVWLYHKTSSIDKAAIDDPKRQGAVRTEPKVGALGEHLGAYFQ